MRCCGEARHHLARQIEARAPRAADLGVERAHAPRGVEHEHEIEALAGLGRRAVLAYGAGERDAEQHQRERARGEREHARPRSRRRAPAATTRATPGQRARALAPRRHERCDERGEQRDDEQRGPLEGVDAEQRRERVDHRAAGGIDASTKRCAASSAARSCALALASLCGAEALGVEVAQAGERAGPARVAHATAPASAASSSVVSDSTATPKRRAR